MAGDEAFLFTSLVLVLAIFLKRRRAFIRRMHLISQQSRQISRRNFVSASDQFGHRLEPTSEGLLSLLSLLDAAEVGVFPGGVAATKCGTAVGRA